MQHLDPRMVDHHQTPIVAVLIYEHVRMTNSEVEKHQLINMVMHGLNKRDRRCEALLLLLAAVKRSKLL